MIELSTNLGIMILGVASILALIRLIFGPTVADRIAAADNVFLNGLAIIVLLGIRFGTSMYLDPALIIAAVFFIGTVSFCKFLLRGKIID